MTTTVAAQTERSLAHLPVGSFAMVMGLSGLAVAWLKAGELLETGPVIGHSIGVLALAIFLFISVGYLIKAVRFPSALVAEWSHPVRSAFTATIAISLLVLAVVFENWIPVLSAILWWAGAALQAGITLWVVRTWITDAAIQPVHVHPAWFIPAVGNIVAPIAGATHAPAVINWYFFGVGAVYYLGLLPIILTRLFTVGTLPPRLVPTLAILIAPPAVASLAWVRLGGNWDDPLVKILIGVGLFQLLLLLVQLPALRAVPFAMSSWAYSFPLAALATAMLASTLGGGFEYTLAATALLLVTSAAVLLMLVLTGISALRGEICRPE